MNKKEQEQKLLADASQWFKEKHGKSSEEFGMKFVTIWHKPALFQKVTAVVFAPNEEAGKAFLWEQNVILRTMENFWLVPVFFILTMFIAVAQETHKAAFLVLGCGMLICFLMGQSMFCLSRKCKKCEKIHEWNVEVYYPED